MTAGPEAARPPRQPAPSPGMMGAMIRTTLSATIALLLAMPLAFAFDPGNDVQTTELFEARIYKSADGGGSIPYRLRMPLNWDTSAERLPLVLFLHGAGERGSDNASQLTWGGRMLGRGFQAKHPCFVVAPQCPPGRQWVDTPWTTGSYSTRAVKESDELRMAVEIVRGVMKEFGNSIDPDRVYVMGLSMGGYGTWDAVTRHPDLFAAAVPICGGGDPGMAGAIKAPVWAFHGGADTVVPPRASREMIDALKKSGAEPKYTEYEGVGHNSWVNAWAEKDLGDWLFAQKRK